MPTFLLIRHGENEYVAKGRLAGRLPGVHLNENGKKQAEAVAKAFAKAPIKAVYSSPMERCMETAQPLAAVLDLEIVPRVGLIEVDFGECNLVERLCQELELSESDAHQLLDAHGLEFGRRCRFCPERGA